MNRLVDSIVAEDFTLQENQISKCNETYKKRFETLKSIDFNDVDYITIFYGTNDWNYGRILKSEDDANVENKQRTNVEDSIRYCVSKLQEKYPHIKIIVLSPYWCTFDDNNTDKNPNKNGDYLEDYTNYIASIAESMSVTKVINLYKELDSINYSNYEYYMYDGVHPSDRLHKILADILISTIHNLER